MTRSAIAYGTAIAVVGVAIATWIAAPSFAARWTTPVIQPFALSPGYRATVTFVPRLSDTHLIGIILDGSIPTDRLEEIVGSIRDEPTARPGIALELTTGGAPVPVERTRGRGRTTWDIASFSALGGHAYTLVAEVRDAPPDLRRVPTRLFVAVEPLSAEHFGFTILLARVIAAAVAILAAVLAIALHRREPKWPNQAMQRTAGRSAF